VTGWWQRFSAAVEHWWGELRFGREQDSRRIGRRSERSAERFLSRQGYRVLGRNLVGRGWEVDLLCLAPDERSVVLVEVKAGQAGQPSPERRVHAEKRRRLIAAATVLAKRYRFTNRPVRFDVVVLIWPDRRAVGEPEVRHYRGAFEGR